MSKKGYTPHLVSLLLTFALLLGGAAPVAQGQQRRERRVETPRPAPAATPTPAPDADAARPGATPLPSPTPTPTPTVTAPARTPAPQTLEELRARIQEIVRRPEFASSMLAVKVASLDTGRTLYEENANKWMQPASNMKLYTVAAALDRLTPDFRFVTSVYAPQRPDASGTIRGDLIVYGRGDPTFATRFNGEGGSNSSSNGGSNGDGGDGAGYYRGVDELAANIHAAGVRRVEGDLVGDESYFTGGTLAPGWEWDDLQWWYGAEVSALTINDNSVDLTVKPGARAGDPCQITLGPSTPLLTVVDRTATAPRGTPRELSVNRPLGQNVIEVSGRMPLDDRGYTASVAVSHPALMFATLLRTALERRRIVVTGRTRTIDARARAETSPLLASALVELAVRQSPPLSVIAAQTLKPSQNLYTELLLRTLGKTVSYEMKKSTDEAGIDVVRNFLLGAGIDAGKLVMLDGSGLSRGNLVTAETTTALLVYMNRHRYGAAFRAALPVAGVDGTLRNRMKGTPATGNARAKTGTLSSSTTLSGYVFSAGGERLVFSLMINNPPRDADPRTSFTDAVTVLLASFAGHS